VYTFTLLSRGDHAFAEEPCACILSTAFTRTHTHTHVDTHVHTHVHVNLLTLSHTEALQ